MAPFAIAMFAPRGLTGERPPAWNFAQFRLPSGSVGGTLLGTSSTDGSNPEGVRGPTNSLLSSAIRVLCSGLVWRVLADWTL
jgi:hypothetical protein